MAKLLANQDNITSPSIDYPNGSTRDKAGVVPGTLTQRGVFGDIIQFFQKLLIDAGITANDAYDNTTNGYQLIEALRLHLRLQALVTYASTSNVAVHTMANTTDLLAVTFAATNNIALIDLPDPTLAINLNKIISIYNTGNNVITLKNIEINNPDTIRKSSIFNLDNIHSIMLRSNGVKWMVFSQVDRELPT